MFSGKGEKETPLEMLANFIMITIPKGIAIGVAICAFGYLYNKIFIN